MEKFIFMSIAAVWGICFLKIILISLKTIKLVKRKYPSEWEDEFQHKMGTSIFGGRSVFQFFAKLDDPEIDYLKKRWDVALRQFFFLVTFSTVLVVAYIVIAEN